MGSSAGIPGSRAKAVLGSAWQLDFALYSLCFFPSLLTITSELASWRAQPEIEVRKDMHVNEGSLSNGHPAKHFRYPALGTFPDNLMTGQQLRTLLQSRKQALGAGGDLPVVRHLARGRVREDGSRGTPRGHMCDLGTAGQDN